ncbi:hypothetical protein Pcinc_032919 [Petrolisthes cinctipes]|uniref:Choline/carnitine acyltransferase domain-containing protein n=1 Tax=Petrolisthes cinctipes TaxID=88211 RepID=A0AAE1ETN1_PETCI|nr:hypothetical protein Pcinc_032919 [Petrolisthes cinctipes]
MLLIPSKMQSPKLIINHCKNVQYHWKQVSGSVRASAACQLHSSSVQCSTTSDDDYQYFHKSKTPSMHFQKSLLRLLIPAKSDTDLFRRITRWTPSAIAAYSAYAFKAFPLDMSQFVNLFNSTRVPEQDKDRLKSDPKASHMLIMKNGHFYVFDVFDRDDAWSPSNLGKMAF